MREKQILRLRVKCNAKLETGRTHQIRVHLTHLGNPLLQDPLYGTGFKTKVDILPEKVKGAVMGLKRQALHASKLAFEHPISGKFLDFSSPLPPDMVRIEKMFEGL